MAIEGKVRTLYTDKTQQEAIFPTTKVSAVTDDEGNGLNTLLEHIAYVDPMDMESAAVLANADTLGGYPASDYAFVEDLKNLKPEDIGAAPAGFGLGNDNSRFISESEDLDFYRSNGFYSWAVAPKNSPGFDNGIMIIASYDWARKVQFVWSTGDPRGCMVQRVQYANIWGEWEYVNPSLLNGVEYRTTERWNGKPVYAQTIGLGEMPNSSDKQINHNIANIEHIVEARGSSSRGYFFPLDWSDPSVGKVSLYVNAKNIIIECETDWTGYSCDVIMKYTKTTD